MAENDDTQHCSSPWSELPPEILVIISDLLISDKDAAGNLRLRSICSAWRSAVPLFRPNFKVIAFKSFLPAFLNPNCIGYFSLSSSAIYFLQSPAAEPSPPPWWLLRVEEVEFGKLRSLNPFSRTLTKKNHMSEFCRELNLLNVRICGIGRAYDFVYVELGFRMIPRCKRVVVSSRKWMSDEGSYYAVLALLSAAEGNCVVVLAHLSADFRFVKLSDENLNRIDSLGVSNYDDILFSNKKQVFYGLDSSGRLIAIDRNLQVKEVVPPMPSGFIVNSDRRLIESSGELFLVNKLSSDVNGEVVIEIDVYKLNEKKKEWEYVNSLGDQAFFVGDDCSYAVKAPFFGLEGNCIYFVDDRFLVNNENDANLGELCTGACIYSLKDRSCCSLASYPDRSKIFSTSLLHG